MSDQDVSIECPHCGEAFQLTEALAAPLLNAERKKLQAEARSFVHAERAQVEAKAKAAAEAEYAEERKALQAAMLKRDEQVRAAQAAELAARKAQKAADEAGRNVELSVERKVQALREQIMQEAAAKANADSEAAIKAMNAELEAKDAKLREAQTAELEARRLKAEAEEAKREVELRVTRQMDAERAKVREAAVKERDDEHRLQLAEKDEQIRAMNQQVEELRRKGTSGSQQLAGEVLELSIEEILRHAFPQDRFDPVPKGQNGGDLIQTVMSPTGVSSGKIVWECKRTKAWNKAWLSKLREDQRAVSANLAVIATETLPDGVSSFDCIEAVWVTPLPTITAVATALRAGLIETDKARRAAAIDDTAKDRVFSYLTTPQFRQRIMQAVEAHTEMCSDLDAEKRSTKRLWAKREKQLDRVLGGIAGMYGDLQGIVGSGMPTLEKLELPGLEGPDAKPRLTMVVGSSSPAASDDAEAS